MSIVAEFSVSSPEITLTEATTAVPSVELELTNQIATDPERPILFFWATGEDLDAFDDHLRADWSVTDVEVHTDFGDRRLYRARLSEAVELVSYQVWVEAGASRLESTCQDGVWRNRFRFPNRESFREVRQWCLDNDITFTLHALYTETSNGHGTNATGLTPGQRRTLERAYEAGLYEIPQGATIADVAADLGVSEQAVSERLRRAHRTLVERHVFEDE